jgi:undecaprenyl-diphosphatase
VALDTDVFAWINRGWENPVLDVLFVALGVAGLLWVWLGWCVPLWLRGHRDLALDLLFVLLLDAVVVAILKPLVGRERPTEPARLLPVPFDPVAGEFAFPSGHASRAFAAAALLGARFRRYVVPLYAYAVLMALGRVYVGAHRPTDVLAGAAVGSLAALALFLLRDRSWYRAWRGRIASLLSRGRPAAVNPDP